MSQQLPERIVTWLNNRLITNQIIETFGISWDATRSKIVIPVRNKDGVFLFNKYRKDPDDKGDDPKYMYDKGSSTQLYGIDSLFADQSAIDMKLPVFLCEGEFDALVLRGQGLLSVSATGGCQSFKEEWIDMFKDRDVYVCYDYDKPGIQGAFHVQRYLPEAKLMWLPLYMGMYPPDKVDITDFFTTLKKQPKDFERVIVAAKPYELPKQSEVLPRTKKELLDTAKMLAGTIEKLMDRKRTAIRQNFPVTHLEILINLWTSEYEYYKRRAQTFSKKKISPSESSTLAARIEAAKKIPIADFIRFDRAKKAKSLWNPEEKTPSMHYYEKDNRVHCFSTNNSGDVIDVVQMLNNVDLEGALNIILGETKTLI